MKPVFENKKPALTQSTHSMLMSNIQAFNIKQIHDDEINVDGDGTPGLKRLLFAIDHYRKPCDKVLTKACKPLWDEMYNSQFEKLLEAVLPDIVPAFEDCIRVHRILAVLIDKYDRTATTCSIVDCLCKEQVEI